MPAGPRVLTVAGADVQADLTDMFHNCMVVEGPSGLTTTWLQVPRVLTVAGSDSGGGAGIQADLKTYQARGVFGTSAVSALTAQNTKGVRGVHTVPTQHLTDQMEAVLSDIGADVVKTGMLPTVEVKFDTAQVAHV